MAHTFQVELGSLQPSQLYISTAKLAVVLRDFPSQAPSLEPLPIKRLGDDVILTDGHTRAFAAFLCGFDQVPAYWDEDELDWEAYRICVDWCREASIHTIADLVGHVVSPEAYEVLWYQRCAAMQQDLAARRRAGRGAGQT